MTELTWRFEAATAYAVGPGWRSLHRRCPLYVYKHILLGFAFSYRYIMDGNVTGEIELLPPVRLYSNCDITAILVRDTTALPNGLPWQDKSVTPISDARPIVDT